MGTVFFLIFLVILFLSLFFGVMWIMDYFMRRRDNY